MKTEELKKLFEAIDMKTDYSDSDFETYIGENLLKKQEKIQVNLFKQLEDLNTEFK